MRLLLALIVAIGLTACTKKEPPPKPTKREMPIGPGAHLNTDKPDKTRVGVDLATLTGAIKMYRAMNDRLPGSLGELDVKVHYPKDIVYDANTGKVRSRTFPDLMAGQ